MASLAEIRQKYPQYSDLSDQALADALYQRHYSDVPRAEFDQKIGLSSGGQPTPSQGQDPANPTISVGGRQIPIAEYRAMSSADRQAMQDQIMDANPDAPGMARGSEIGGGFNLDSIAQGTTLGWGDELRGATQGAMAAMQGGDFGATYRNETDLARAELDTQRRRNPVQSAVGEIGGAVVTGGAAGGQLAGRGATLLPRALSGAGVGAAQGAAYGAGASGEGERGTGALFGGATGGILGGALPAVAQGFRGLFQRNGGVMPEIDDLYKARDAAYDMVDRSGFRYNPQQVDGLMNDIYRRVGQEGIDSAPDGAHKAAVRMLQRLNSRQGPMTLKQVDQLRQVIRRDVVDNGSRADGHFGRMMIDAIDDFIDQSGGGQTMGAARTAHQVVRKSELLADALDQARMNAASSGSGGNIDNAIRQQMKRILRNKSQVRSFTQSERDAMRKIVEGGAPMQGLLRLVGKLSPSGSGLMASLGVGATAVNPLMAIPVGAGIASKNIADGMTERGAQALQRAVRTSGGVGAPSAQLPRPGLLQQLMRSGAVPMIGGRVGESVSGGGAW